MHNLSAVMAQGVDLNTEYRLKKTPQIITFYQLMII